MSFATYLGFFLTYILYQDGDPNIISTLRNLISLSVTVAMSFWVALLLIEFYIGMGQSGH
ncbi:MAG TPA: hypothetical protein DCF68_00885 [Cyanothece sp. UBA12306]|nr:hypothetical protein [Cyanothece sp. UBA12306]